MDIFGLSLDQQCDGGHVTIASHKLRELLSQHASLLVSGLLTAFTATQACVQQRNDSPRFCCQKPDARAMCTASGKRSTLSSVPSSKRPPTHMFHYIEIQSNAVIKIQLLPCCGCSLLDYTCLLSGVLQWTNRCAAAHARLRKRSTTAKGCIRA